MSLFKNIRPGLRKMVSGSYNSSRLDDAMHPISNYHLRYKKVIRGIYKGYFNLRYLNTPDTHNNDTSPLLNHDSKMQELFEFSDKAKFLSAGLLSISFNEVSTVDSYKENYPFTSAYARFHRILVLKEFYLYDASDYYKEEIQKCLDNLENYINVYETVQLLSSFSEEVKLLSQKIYPYSQSIYFKYLGSANLYETKEKLHADLKVILDNYKRISRELDEYPLWKEKFESEISKLIAITNIKFDCHEIYELIDQQKLFK